MTLTRLTRKLPGFFCLMGLLASAGCTTTPSPSPIVTPDTSKLGHKPVLTIVVVRNKRLPPEFTTELRQQSQKALPDFQITVTEGGTDNQAYAQSDWIMTVRATRIIPNYTFKPFSDNALNGVNDCFWGSGFGVGLLFLPCPVTGDSDFLEANLRDAHGNTLKTYVEAAAEGGFTLFPPLTYLTNREPKARWQNMIHTLYGKLSSDHVFDHSAKP